MREESLGDALSRVADDLERVLAEARSAHGAFVSLPRRLDSPGDTMPARHTSVELLTADHLVAALREEADVARRRAPGLPVSGSVRVSRPDGDDPATVRQWWEALSEPEREEVVVSDPLYTGSADGLPVQVRHRANMLVLDAEIVRRTAELAATPGAGSGGSAPPAPGERQPTTGPVIRAVAGLPVLDDPDGRRAEEEARDLRGLLKLRALFLPHTADDPAWADARTVEALNRVGTPVGDRYCYLLDAAAYPLKAAVVLGDLDRADHVVLHVPGATTTVDQRLFREAAWMSTLRAEAGRHVGADRVAVVDWLGYRAPYDVAVRRPLGDSGVPLLLPGEAADPQYAHEATPALVRCAEGLRVITGARTRLVASGHSYGGSVIGLALTRTDVFDAAIVSGCPGLFTGDAATLRLPEGALFAATAPGDVVALLGIFGGPTPQVTGIRSLSTRARPVTYPDGGRALLLPVFGHEAYYNAGTATVHGMGAVVAGSMDQVRATAPRGGTTSALAETVD